MRPWTLFVVMGPCLFLSKWFDMFCSCSIVSYDISKLRVTSLFLLLNNSWTEIQYYWVGVRGTQEKKLNYKTLHSFISWSFARSKGQLRVLWLRWVWIMHHRAEKPWETCFTCVDYWRSYRFFPPPLSSGEKGPFVCGVSDCSCLNSLEAKWA